MLLSRLSRVCPERHRSLPRQNMLAPMALAASLMLTACGQGNAPATGPGGAGGKPPLVEVGVLTVKLSEVGLVSELPGRLEASRVAQVRARAAFFPRISLTAGAGSASSALGDLFKTGSWGWTLAPQLVLPIFDAGRNQASLDAARAGRDIALAQYEKTIQTAFREVADGLASRATLLDQLQAQQALLNAEAARSQLTRLRLTHGVASQLDWLDAQRALFAAQQAMVQTRLASLQNQIALFKTLGGATGTP